MRILFLFQSLLLSVIYLWSQANSDRIVSFMFGVQFKVNRCRKRKKEKKKTIKEEAGREDRRSH